jgi:hypothetical protein
VIAPVVLHVEVSGLQRKCVDRQRPAQAHRMQWSRRLALRVRECRRGAAGEWSVALDATA